MYEFKVDLAGDAMPTDAAIVVRRMEGADAANPDAVGVIVASVNTDEVVKTPSGLRVWAGKARDPFLD
ncbi:MAG TPA: hypothetical protein VKT81_26745 [Bryobacteraceae bacterium]|nr:hypothetical protein [Bryobacteraceae bacterium]